MLFDLYFLAPAARLPADSVLRLIDPAGRQVAANDAREDKGSGLNTHHADSYLCARPGYRLDGATVPAEAGQAMFTLAEPLDAPDGLSVKEADSDGLVLQADQMKLRAGQTCNLIITASGARLLPADAPHAAANAFRVSLGTFPAVTYSIVQ